MTNFDAPGATLGQLPQEMLSREVCLHGLGPRSVILGGREDKRDIEITGERKSTGFGQKALVRLRE